MSTQVYTPPANFYCFNDDVMALVAGVNLTDLSNRLAAGKLPGFNVMDVPTLVTKYYIPSAEADADDVMRRSFRPTQVSRALDGNGLSVIQLPFYPVVSVDYVEITVLPGQQFYTFSRIVYTDNDGPIDPAQQVNCDLLVSRPTGKITIPPRVSFEQTGNPSPNWDYTFLGGSQNIQVTWTYGGTDPNSVPSNIREAVAKLAAVKLLKSVGQVSMDGLSEIVFDNNHRLAGRNINLPYGDLIKTYTDEATATLKRKRTMGA